MLAVGKLFKSYSNFLSELQNTFFYDFSTSHCRTLNVAHKKYPNKLEFTPDSLKYYFLSLSAFMVVLLRKVKM